MLTHNRSAWGLVALLALVGCPVAHVHGQPTDAQNKLLARRAAEADCYRKLAESVYGLSITSDTYVRDFVTESDEIRTSVDTFVKGIRLGTPRYYEDGMCEVDAEVTVAKVVTKLKEFHHTHYQGNRVTTTDIENIVKTVKKDIIRVTGAGAPRPDLPADLPTGIEDVLTPLPPAVTLSPPIPAIWKTIPPQARLMAQRAARLDALRKLLEQIKGLRLTSDTLVRDFVTESDEIRASGQANNFGLGASEVSKYFHDDELIVEVTMEIPLERVVTKIKELHEEHYRGNRVTTTDITNVKKSVERTMIRATGAGVPPSRFLAQARSADVDMPDWVARPLQATGQGTDPQINTAQGKLRAARAAEVVAMRNLAERVYGLSIRSNTSVRDFVTEYDEISTLVEGVISDAVTSDPVFSEDIATVTVTLSSGDVWSTIHQHMRIVKRRG